MLPIGHSAGCTWREAISGANAVTHDSTTHEMNTTRAARCCLDSRAARVATRWLLVENGSGWQSVSEARIPRLAALAPVKVSRSHR
jgi:hypothetical protein